MTTIEYRETEETIQVLVHRPDLHTETYFLDADDTAWELTLNDKGQATEFRINETGEQAVRGDISSDDWDLYAGFYQGLAFAQGATDGPLEFVWPDELMRRDALAPLNFNRNDFFDVVASLDDEGFIHRWDHYAPGQWNGVLWCTEDATPHDIPETALHAGNIPRS